MCCWRSAETFSNFLKSERDFVKHLSRVGLKVHYQQQEAVNELEFTVSNLRVDWNDGVRLTRMTELVTKYVAVVCCCPNFDSPQSRDCKNFI